MLAIIVGLTLTALGAVCVNRARTPDGANWGMVLFVVGGCGALVSAAVWCLS